MGTRSAPLRRGFLFRAGRHHFAKVQECVTATGHERRRTGGSYHDKSPGRHSAVCLHSRASHRDRARCCDTTNLTCRLGSGGLGT
jgi:hypothetical protein